MWKAFKEWLYATFTFGGSSESSYTAHKETKYMWEIGTTAKEQTLSFSPQADGTVRMEFRNKDTGVVDRFSTLDPVTFQNLCSQIEWCKACLKK